jgi:hypothetical protein
MVWQSNRYGQYCYRAFIPFNPRTPAQVAVRGVFGAVSARWRTLTEEQRVVWCAVAKHKKSKPRLRQCGPLTGFLLFVKINVALANRGLPQVDLPPEASEASQRIVASLNYTGKFDQPSVGPTLFLGRKKEECRNRRSAGRRFGGIHLEVQGRCANSGFLCLRRADWLLLGLRGVSNFGIVHSGFCLFAANSTIRRLARRKRSASVVVR